MMDKKYKKYFDNDTNEYIELYICNETNPEVCYNYIEKNYNMINIDIK